MSTLFSSPSKQANSAAQAQQGIADHSIQQAEQYISGEQEKLRGAIGGLGPNPYLAAGANMSPDGFRVDPSNTITAGPGALPPGLSAGGDPTLSGPTASAARPVNGLPGQRKPQAVVPPPPPGPPPTNMPSPGANPFLKRMG